MRNLMIAVLFVFSCTSLALAQDDYHKVEVYGGYSYGSIDKIAGSELSTFNSDPGNPDRTGTGGKRRGYNGFDTSVTYNFSRYVGAKFNVSGHYGAVTCKGDIQDSTQFLACIEKEQLTSIPSLILINPRTATFPAFPGGMVIVPSMASQTSQTSYNFLGGIQIKDNSKNKRFKPFAHGLLGVARQTVKYKEEGSRRNSIFVRDAILGSDKVTNNGFSWVLGGGLDIRVHRRIDIRVVQFDYNPVRTKDQTLFARGTTIMFSSQPDCLSLSAANRALFPECNGGQDQAGSVQNLGILSRTQHNFRIGFGIVFH